MSDKPYQGLKVVDFTTTIAGPYCTRLLADLGAEVVKIESPEGDMMRGRPPLRDGLSSAFGQLNAGKKSVVLDLKRAEDIALARALIAQSDVLVENFRPGVMKRFGLDYASLAADHPRLVYCSISGYGQTGPSSQAPAYAPVVHAASGHDLAHISYQHNRDRPDWCSVFTADVMAGLYAFSAIGPALHQRARTGRGQMIDVSMLEAMLSLCLNEVQLAQFDTPLLRKSMFGPLSTTDGYVMVAVASEKTFQNLAAAAGRPELVTDPRFEVYLTRRGNWGELLAEVETWTRTLSSRDCLAALERHGVPASPYRTVAEALADPQIAHRGALAEVRDDAGSYRVVNAPFRMSGAEVSVRPWVSALGQHTNEVLASIGVVPRR